ncbi:MAG: hypothetical protein WCB19_06850 [Thermoplasmata archaeon]
MVDLDFIIGTSGITRFGTTQIPVVIVERVGALLAVPSSTARVADKARAAATYRAFLAVGHLPRVARTNTTPGAGRVDRKRVPESMV